MTTTPPSNNQNDTIHPIESTPFIPPTTMTNMTLDDNNNQFSTKLDTELNSNGLPLLPLDLSKHKLSITLNWLPILLTSGILPIAGYFALRYGTSENLTIVFAPWLALMGVVSLFSLIRRTWALFRQDSTCRPLGQESRWGLDFFDWNFLFGFVVLTAFISAGISTKNITVVSLPTSILLLYVCLEIITVPVFMAMNLRAPIRFSSVAKGDELRPATFIIVEDIVAVDGKMGQAWRRAWSARYEASPVFRAHLKRMDLLWGWTGLATVAIIWGLVFGLDTTRVPREIAYSLGWGLPWIWAGKMTLVTIFMTKRMLREEARMQSPNQIA